MQGRGNDHLGSFSNSKREHWTLFGGVGFYPRRPICRRANRVSENNSTPRRGGRLFWELWTRKILTVGAPLPLWGTPRQKVVQVSRTNSSRKSSNHSKCFMLSSSPEKELREVFASMRLKHGALCCRNDSSMRAIRTNLCFRAE